MSVDARQDQIGNIRVAAGCIRPPSKLLLESNFEGRRKLSQRHWTSSSHPTCLLRCSLIPSPGLLCDSQGCWPSGGRPRRPPRRRPTRWLLEPIRQKKVLQKQLAKRKKACQESLAPPGTHCRAPRLQPAMPFRRWVGEQEPRFLSLKVRISSNGTSERLLIMATRPHTSYNLLRPSCWRAGQDDLSRPQHATSVRHPQPKHISSH